MPPDCKGYCTKAVRHCNRPDCAGCSWCGCEAYAHARVSDFHSAVTEPCNILENQTHCVEAILSSLPALRRAYTMAGHHGCAGCSLHQVLIGDTIPERATALSVLAFLATQSPASTLSLWATAPDRVAAVVRGLRGACSRCADSGRVIIRRLDLSQLSLPSLASRLGRNATEQMVRVGAADVARFRILHEAGGIYLDSDTVPQPGRESHLRATGLSNGPRPSAPHDEPRTRGSKRPRAAPNPLRSAASAAAPVLAV